MVFAMWLLLAGAAFAQYREGQLGIGGVFSGGGDFMGRDFYGGGSAGLSLRLPTVPVFWGLSFRSFGDFMGLGVVADHYFFGGSFRDQVLADDEGYTYHLRLDWFAGLGGFANLLFSGDDNSPGFATGVRVPVGLSWHIVRWAEMSVALVPAIGGYFGHGGPAFHWSLGAELALRYWFTPRTRRANAAAQNGAAAVEVRAEEAVEAAPNGYAEPLYGYGEYEP